MGEITRDELSKELREDIVYNSDNIARPAEVEIHGRTLVNQLGRYGNAIYKKFGADNTHGTLTYESDVFVLTNSGENAWTTTLSTDHIFEKGKYYICLGEILLESGDRAYVNITCTTTDQNKSQYLITEKNKWMTSWQSILIGDAANGHPKPYFAFVLMGTDVKAKFKNLRIYEIDKTTHDKLPTMTRDEIAKMFPYVDDVKCVLNPYIESRENLLDQVPMCLGTIGYKGNVATSTTSAYATTEIVTDVNIGDTFTLSLESTKYDMSQYLVRLVNCLGTAWETETLEHYNASEPLVYTAKNKGSLVFQIVPADKVRDDSLIEKLHDIKCSLVRGSTPKSYDECHNSRIMFETKLYDGEIISRRNDGIYVKNSEWEEVILDENLVYHLHNTVQSTHRQIRIENITKPRNEIDTELIQYSGKITPKYTQTLYIEDALHYHVDNRYNTNIYISLPQSLTGWGSSYTPTQEEIRAFFLGWKMFGDGSASNAYETSSTSKGWVKLWCGIGTKHATAPTISGTNVSTCPTVLNDQGYTPYRLIYKKLTQTTEEVKTHGSLNIKDGVDINIWSGLVLSENINTQLHSDGLHYINGAYSLTDNRLQKTISIYDDKFSYPFINIFNSNITSHITKGPYYSTYTGKNDNSPIYCDYLIYEADTVTSYDYTISTPQITKDIIEKVVEETSNANRKMSMENKILENKIDRMSKIANPNLLINGDFQVWQRGTSFSKLGAVYTADRWRVGSGDVTVSKPTTNGARIEYDRSSGADSYIVQWVEVTPSFIKNKILTVSAKINGKVYSYTSTLSSTAWTIQGVQTPFGKLYFQNAMDSTHDCVCCGIYMTNPVSFTIAWIKLELGDRATPFIPRLYAEELLMCQRYYQKVFPTEVAATRATTGLIKAYTQLPVEMRTIPTVSGTIDVIDIQSNTGVAVSTRAIYATNKQIASAVTGTFDVTRQYAVMQTYVVADAEIY